MSLEALAPHETAVVTMDMINWQVHPEGGYRRLFGNAEGTAYMGAHTDRVVIPNLQRLLPACRRAGVRVVHLRAGSAVDDYSDLTALFRESFKACGARDGTWACDVLESLEPEAGDVSLLKVGSGGFVAADLDRRLRNMGVKTVIYTGVVTHACVLLTLAAGFDLGYRGLLVSDATASFSDEMQQQTERIVGIYMAHVCSTADIISALPS